MFCKFLAGFLVVATLSVAYPISVGAQSTIETEKIRKKIGKIGTGTDAKVSVRLTNDVRYKGYVREANDTEFVIIDKSGGSHSVKYADVRSVGGSGLSGAAKLALGIGIGVGAVLAVLAAVIASDN